VNLLRRVLVVGVVATLVDVVGLLVLVELAAWPVGWADAVAVAVATVVSFALHMGPTGQRDEPGRRWFTATAPYWLTAAAALLADVAVLVLLVSLLDVGWWLPLLGCKLVALLAALVVRSSNYRDLMFRTVREEQGSPAMRPPVPGAYRLSVVIPAYREGDRIAATVGRVRTDLAGIDAEGGLEVVVVDDGSPDDTAAAARAAGADQVLRHTPNRGKGSAVREGMLAARGSSVVFTDADLSYAPDQVIRLLDGLEAGWDVVVGSRRHTHTLTVVRAGRLREFGGRLVNVFTGVVLLGRYRDTQCGLKGFRSDVARLVFSHARVDGFAFDIEVFHLVERYRLTLAEVPVEVQNSERSTVHVVRDFSRLLRDLARIRAWGRMGAYEADLSVLPPPAARSAR
jgi:dolichyl-phosphate beta-glucosyltransferase